MGLDKAQRVMGVSMGKQRWATENKNQYMGLDRVEFNVGHQGRDLSPGGSVLAQPVPSQSNIELNRVFTSLRDGFEPRQTNSGMGASSEDVRAQEGGASDRSVGPQQWPRSADADS
ncbi:hypothetical protein CsSME_00040163 [Camellia sinensis var. sinensis]